MEVHSILDLPIPTSTDLSHALLPSRLQYIHIQKLQTVLLAFHQPELGVAVCAAAKAEAQICIPRVRVPHHPSHRQSHRHSHRQSHHQSHHLGHLRIARVKYQAIS
jgi:hypothetical protein